MDELIKWRLKIKLDFLLKEAMWYHVMN